MKMKAAIVLCFVVFPAVALARPEDKYTDRYDTIDLDEILGNDRLLIPYVNCLLGKGKCTAEAKELNLHVEDAMKTDCAKCTDLQKKGTDKVISHLVNEKPDHWKDLKAKFDPAGKYAPEIEKRLKKVKKE